jgi:NADH-quinone oxidoreductase subunit L
MTTIRRIQTGEADLFKALLFLAAGSVMHALHEVIDIRRMGNLHRKMPLTYISFLLGAVALAGFPLTSGFFSKDEILVKAFEFSPVLWAIGPLTALLTAFYTFRALFVAFWGQPRDWELFEHAHESPRVMTWPLIVLAALALVGGLLGLPSVLGVGNALDGWLDPVLATAHLSGEGLASGAEWALLGVSAAVALAGIGLAYWFYVARPDIPQRLAVTFRPLFTLLINKYYVDDLYDTLFVRSGKWLARVLAQGFDQVVLDGVIDGGAGLFVRGGAWLARMEDGHIPHYALAMFVGAVFMLAYLVLH